MMGSCNSQPHCLTVKWGGKEYELEDINRLRTVRDLKEVIQSKTGVKVDRQKILNLTYKGKLAQDDCTLSKLSLRQGQKLMMMGSLEVDIEGVHIPPEEDRPDVTNDMDTGPDEDADEEPFEIRQAYLDKIATRVKEYKIKWITPPRPDKKLLVLDIDYTLMDHRSSAATAVELMRPFLHEFLTVAYQDYDIAIWSATGMKAIHDKMRRVGVSSNPSYKIAFHLDYQAMISVDTPKDGVVQVKPLGVIWGKFPQYSAKNTVMIDDLRRNFLMNPQSGLRIRQFKSAHLNRDSDCELVYLANYLRKIAKLDDFSSLNHRLWKSYTMEANHIPSSKHGGGSTLQPPKSGD